MNEVQSGAHQSEDTRKMMNEIAKKVNNPEEEVASTDNTTGKTFLQKLQAQNELTDNQATAPTNNDQTPHSSPDNDEEMKDEQPTVTRAPNVICNMSQIDET